jgi:tetratricopeptide (TPR) repeat protein
MKATLPVRAAAFLAAALLCVGAALGQQSTDALATARSLATAGKLTQSESVLHAFIAENPSSADGYFLLGYVYFRQGRPRKSLAAFTSGARLRRPGADDFKVVASDYVMLGDYPDAQKWFSEVTKERPNDADTWYLLGRTQYNEDQFQTAIASFQKALALRPKYVEAENNLGLAWQGLNQSGMATAAYHQAIEWQSDSPVDAQPFLNLGILLTDQGQATDALPWLRQAVKLAPKNPKAHEEMARALEASNQLPQAQHQLEEAAALAPNASGPHFKLGRLYQREGMKELARQQFEICQKLYSTHSSVNTPNPYTPKE